MTGSFGFAVLVLEKKGWRSSMNSNIGIFTNRLSILLFLAALLLGCAGMNSTEQSVSSGAAAGSGSGAGTFETQISCYGTPGTGMTRCFAGGQIVSARLQTDASETGASCQSANSWGYRGNWIWVSGNCSGVFAVTISRQ